jgi:outer membrane protein TolC
MRKTVALKIFGLALTILLLTFEAQGANTLSLDEFIRTAINNNPSYQIAAQNYIIALESDKSIQSLEDWNLITSGFWNEARPAPISSFSSEYQKTTGYSFGVEKYFAGTGTAMQIQHSNTRIEATYPPPVTIPGIGTMDFNPPPKYYLSDLSLTITQPLLKNAFGLATRNALKMSAYSVDLAEIKLSEDWEDFITRLRSEYLTWQKCFRNVKLFADKVKTVENQLALVQKQLKYGLSEDLDLVQIKQKNEGYKILLEQAKLACETQTMKILKLMGKATTTPPKIIPEKFVKNGPVMNETTALNYLNSTSNINQTADIMVALQKINLETKENAQSMDLNLILQAKPNTFSDKFSDSIRNIGDYSDNSITLSGSQPLFNQQAVAEAIKAQAEYTKAQEQKKDIMLNSEIALATLYTNLDRLNNMLKLNENNLKLAKKRLALEEKKFDQGRNSIFFVLQAEDDAIVAENSLNETLFAREEIINQIRSLTDRYLVEYEDILKL